MEGDAGASRLNPAETDDSLPSEVKSEDSSEPEARADHASTANEADETSTETTDEPESETISVDEGNPSRLGRRWFIGIAAALVVLAGGVGAGGYFAMRAHQESQTIARHDAEAVQNAKDCVAATQAPDAAAMAAGAQKVVDCSTGAFREQAVLYSGLFIQAYQVANVHVQVSDMRAAAERNQADGSVDVLVAMRVKVSNTQAENREVGYRLRVTMAPDEGKYRIAKLVQVAK